MQNEIPRRFREPAFRTFERTIAAVLNAYPAVITINPRHHNLAQETFAARFRDAMRSYAKYGWKSTYIDKEKFFLVCEKISVSMPDASVMVRIGDKDELKKPSLEVQDNPHRVHSLPNIEHLIKLGSVTELDLICKLAALRLLSAEVKCTGFTEQTKKEYEQRYDVSIELNPATGIASVL